MAEDTNEGLLKALQTKLILRLTALIDSGEAKPADLAVATKLLKDNDITCLPGAGDVGAFLTNLEAKIGEKLPFLTSDQLPA